MVHRGVYAIGSQPLSRPGVMLAATLAVQGGVVSHGSAADLWQLARFRLRPVHVSTTGAGRSRSGITAHHSSSLTDFEITERNRIPCTSVARTLLDLAATEHPAKLEKAIREAEYQRLLNLNEVNRLLELRFSRKGTGILADLLHSLTQDPDRTRTELERRFARLCADAGIAAPRFNEPLTLLDGSEVVVDALWRRPRVIAELDGRAAHATMTAFERDRHRDAQHTASGWRVLRFTWRQVADHPETVADLIKRVIKPQNGPALTTTRPAPSPPNPPASYVPNHE